jgi:PAS domain S-box-containing protein
VLYPATVGYEELFDALNLQIWTADESGALTFVNEFTAGYFGKSREQLIGEGWQNVLHSADLSLAVEQWTTAIRTGEPYHVDFRLLRATDRSYRWHHASARLIVTNGAKLWLGSNIDVDAGKRSDEIMQAWREQLASRDDSNR